MWFKNLTLYRLAEPFAPDHDALHAALAAHPFQHVGRTSPLSMGWELPLGQHGSQYCHSVGRYSMICLRREERLLPSAVVNEQLLEKVRQLEETQGRPVRRKEKLQLKDELVLSLLPQAFTRSARQFAYIDREHGWLVVDTASAKRAEELLKFLRESMEAAGHGLRVRLAETQGSPRVVMSQWLQGEGLPAYFELGQEYELQDPMSEGGVVRCRRQDPLAPEVQAHLQAGKQVSKLALAWRERLELVLDEELVVRRLRFSDTMKEETAAEGGDPASEFDADFALMSMELSGLVRDLMAAFGGEAE